MGASKARLLILTFHLLIAFSLCPEPLLIKCEIDQLTLGQFLGIKDEQEKREKGLHAD